MCIRDSGRLEQDILQGYARERAKDFGIELIEEDVSDMKRWCKEQSPTTEEVEAAIHRHADSKDFSAHGLWELIEIVLTIDRKVSKEEKAIARELGGFIRDASGVMPWR